MKALLSGNEAIARGAYEAGIQVAAGYPGTPSKPYILNEFGKIDDEHLYFLDTETEIISYPAGKYGMILLHPNQNAPRR